MKFKSDYSKSNDKNVLDDDFIKSLALKMAQASESENTEQTNDNKEGSIMKVINYKNNIIPKCVSFAAAVAVIAFSISILKPDNNLNIEPDRNISTVTTAPENLAKHSESNTAKSSKTTKSTTFVTSGTPQTSIAVSAQAVTNNNNTTTTARPNTAPAASDSGIRSEIINSVNSLKLDGSPIATNYQDNDYAYMYHLYDNFEYIDNGNGFTVSNSDPKEKSLTYLYQYLKYDFSYTQHKFSSSSLSDKEADQYKRLLDYINTNVGSDKYYIYDIYNYNYTCSYQLGGKSQMACDSSSDGNYGISIVLKDYINEYKTCGKNKYIISFEIMNDKGVCNNNDQIIDPCKLDSVLASQYEHFLMAYPNLNKICDEFTAQFSNCAIDIASSSFSEVSSQSYSDNFKYLNDSYIVGTNMLKEPLWPKDTSRHEYAHTIISPEYTFIFPEATKNPDQYNDYQYSPTIYFKPGTTEEDMMQQLNEMSEFLLDHHMWSVCVDILNSEDTFEYARNNYGYIPDKTIDASFRNCYYIEKTDEKINIYQGWPGK